MAGSPHITNWDEIEKLAIAGVDYPELSRRFDISQNTIRVRARRHKWPTPLAIACRVKQLKAKTPSQAPDLIDAAAQDWHARGEAHRKTAFEKANKSMKKFKVKAPKNFRELKVADDVARRAAGLDISEVNQQTLIMMHEKVNQFDEEPEEIQEIIEAEVIVEALPSSGNEPENEHSGTSNEDEPAKESESPHTNPHAPEAPSVRSPAEEAAQTSEPPALPDPATPPCQAPAQTPA